MEFYISKPKIIKSVILGFIMIGAAIVVLNISENLFLKVVCISGILLFGAMTIAFIIRLLNSEAQVIINFEGIEDKRLNTGFIRWDETNFIMLEENKNSKWLNLKLTEPEKYFHKLPKFQKFLRKANGQIGVNNFRIRFTDLDQPIEDAWEFIEKNIIKPREEKGIHLMP